MDDDVNEEESRFITVLQCLNKKGAGRVNYTGYLRRTRMASGQEWPVAAGGAHPADIAIFNVAQNCKKKSSGKFFYQ